MNIYKSKLWLSDIDEVVGGFSELERMVDSTILITGATGMICSSIIDIILRFNEKSTIGTINIVGGGRSEKRFNQRFSQYIGKSYLKFVTYDAMKNNNLDLKCDYIIHGASNTSPDKYVSEAVETMLGNFIGMKNLLEYANETNVKKVLFISSSEIYGQREGDKPYDETEYGYIDLLKPRSSYALSKRATETLCVSYSFEYGLETVIVRPGHIYGPTASPSDKRVASQWAFAAARGENIVMKSEGLQIRSYCYCVDCASAILKVLIEGENAKAYNISNSNSIVTIKEVAQILAEVGKVELIFDIPTEREKKVFNPMMNSSLNSNLLEMLGWQGLFNAKKGFTHTVKILKDAYTFI